MVRAGLRYSLELCMNARAVTTDILLGIVPIALLVAFWQGLVSFGYAPPTLLPPPGLVFARLAQQLFADENAARGRRGLRRPGVRGQERCLSQDSSAMGTGRELHSIELAGGGG